jgi:hypothetical protein
VKFENKSDARGDVHSAIITCQIRKWHGGYDTPQTRKVTTGVRAIRERNGKWRIDKTAVVAGTWLPWEPIENTEFRTLTAAKSAIRAFARTCRVPK